MIYHLVFDGVADGSIGVALDIVETAARLVRAGRVAAPDGSGPMRQQIVSVDGGSVRTGAGRTMSVDGRLDPEGLGVGDVLVLAGLGAATAPEIAALLDRRDIASGVEIIARAAGAGTLIAASCSATFVLAKARALDGRQATTTWWLSPDFARRFPHVALCSDRMVVDSGSVITAGSAFAHADLMLTVVSRILGPSIAHMVASYLVLDARPSQARYMILEHLRTSDPVIRELEAFVTANLSRQVTLQEMARATATSPRTLARRIKHALGTTPHHFAQRLRMTHAVHLLESTSNSVDEIAGQVGYADPSAFRRVFYRETGTTPSARRLR